MEFLWLLIYFINTGVLCTMNTDTNNECFYRNNHETFFMPNPQKTLVKVEKIVFISEILKNKHSENKLSKFGCLFNFLIDKFVGAFYSSLMALNTFNYTLTNPLVNSENDKFILCNFINYNIELLTSFIILNIFVKEENFLEKISNEYSNNATNDFMIYNCIMIIFENFFPEIRPFENNKEYLEKVLENIHTKPSNLQLETVVKNKNAPNGLNVSLESDINKTLTNKKMFVQENDEINLKILNELYQLLLKTEHENKFNISQVNYYTFNIQVETHNGIYIGPINIEVVNIACQKYLSEYKNKILKTVDNIKFKNESRNNACILCKTFYLLLFFVDALSEQIFDIELLYDIASLNCENSFLR
ncbi:hypothetical protein EDEG_02479 [Edhazardia aedis USNM 41457]|uniref:Uncharacterized protein n=1 Tax=Edhazardia aedis (strain USNM 41457) TaxID=1003232 RepID=J9D6N2_EDHAE|nr:hypothetical protein EDEG_02479 [Edhazardia aedis USNM 41457]|eukprot:EJW03174.1 hypothetical protein EDEG_02479 [Edhazardia aedis USNM 41457]